VLCLRDTRLSDAGRATGVSGVLGAQTTTYTVTTKDAPAGMLLQENRANGGPGGDSE
jgi:hypothetical protein